MANDEDSDPVYPTYCALWARAKAEGAIIRYEGWMPAGASGTFYPYNEDGSVIPGAFP